MAEIRAVRPRGLRGGQGAAGRRSVLVVQGGLSPDRLDSLTRGVVGGDGELDLHVLAYEGGDIVLETGPAALARLAQADPADSMLQTQAPELLRATHATGARTVILGYPAGARRKGSFAEAVTRLRRETDAEVVVCYDRHARPWDRVLVPFLYAGHDAGAVKLAVRLAQQSAIDMTVLHVREPGGEGAEEAALRDSLGGGVRARLKIVSASDPLIAAAHEARQGYDAIVVGGSDGNRLRQQYLTMRHQSLLYGTDASLIVVHGNER